MAGIKVDAAAYLLIALPLFYEWNSITIPLADGDIKIELPKDIKIYENSNFVK